LLVLVDTKCGNINGINQKKLKVIHVLNHYLPERTAGTEVYVHALSVFLKNNGVSVKVVTPHRGYKDSVNFEFQGIEVHQFSETSILDRELIMGFREPDGLSPFMQFIESEKPDIVNFHELAGSNGIGIGHVKLAKSVGSKVVMTFHLAGYSCKTGTLVQNHTHLCAGKIDELRCGSCYLKQKGLKSSSYLISQISFNAKKLGFDFRKMNHPVGTLLGTANVIGRVKNDLTDLVDACDQLVSLTDWYSRILLLNKTPGSKITVIKQGLPLKIIENDSMLEFENQNSPLKLLFLGRISPFKGLHLLINAIKKMPQESVELSIYGDSEEGDYEIKLRYQTANMLNVHWKGKLERTDVIYTMSRHHILCLCSTFSEMSPLVIQEAKAAKLPVLASNVYGNAEQIEDGINGLLFDFNSVESLKFQIQRLISQPELLAVLKSNITDPRSFEEVGREYLQLYQNVLEK